MTSPAPREQTFDVVVVGGGGAGLAAAIAARRAGRTAVLLEKNAALGGSTAWSIGSITSSLTPHQIGRGIKDCPADHWADMPLFAPASLAERDNDALRRILCDEIPDAFRWLTSLGVRFFGPMPEPPHRVPRMHNVLPNSRSFIYHLRREALRAGVDIRLGVRASRLCTDQSGVIGIEGVGPDGSSRFRARGGVVLAAGDFTSSPELKARYMGPQEAKIAGVNPTATGDGQQLALAVGGRILNGDLALGPEIRFIPPTRTTLVRRLPPWPALAAFLQWSMDHMPQSLLRPFVMGFLTTALAPSAALFENGAILVDRDGRRFCDELGRPAYALPDQPGGIGYILIDGRIAKLFEAWPHFVSTAPGVAYAYIADYRRNRPDVFAEAPTLGALAAKLEMNREVLQQAADAGGGKCPPLGEGPFVALGPVRAVFVHSEGGLAVDANHRVLDAGDAPIPGLYAAGATGQGGLLLKGHGHHLAWAFVSGRRAGRIAALAVTTPGPKR